MGEEGKPHSTKKGRIAAGVRRIKRQQKEKVFVEAGSKAKGLGKGKNWKKKKPYKYGIKEIIKDTGKDIKQMGKDIVDPETYKSVAEGYKMVGSDIVSGVKKWLKDEKPKKYLGRPFSKIKKEKDWADPSETVGGRRIQKKGGPELIPPKRKDDVGVGGYQEPFKNIKRPERPAGLGAALRGGGRAFMKGGKV